MTRPYMAVESDFTGTPLVLTASTHYTNPNSARFETSLLFTEVARDEGIPVVIVDSSKDAWVADAHRQRGAIVLLANIGGIATQRQQGVAFAIAHGAEKVVGTESKKPHIPLSAEQISRQLDTVDVLI